jgi:hypothetical protein
MRIAANVACFSNSYWALKQEPYRAVQTCLLFLCGLSEVLPGMCTTLMLLRFPLPLRLCMLATYSQDLTLLVN